ncbi:YlmH family RNA-binding protein [Companilactobacillus sp.]|jgi:RNA-binding protein YlmH|uniref:YlmH family RNA-binding protein n=1 Tax=Companilactobacillus sp. TaxID=2767905 RepID=UPI0025BBF076|nr:YlmH/Sll1252 family protein [Companilactobacillus sp.]MCH4008440.1 YlmH/Sll1252 family protein [Companilactobacillus sp.]MCH4051381.1 YlmH/Sll1252 family protein [Companilactobacillus sp.]MCH4076383.1 YlmH/Sll1252 family protein [Companilactobacillus sp.]MCH4124958.1 YlmH/Sll1252 family protein [Companilactobacillus sp.]MCH4131500.1 YlmH/Sll1252 family protein [Companilactobacillus sp.]
MSDKEKVNMNGGFFRPEEKPFIDKIGDLLLRTQSMYIPQLTDFLNLRQRAILDNLVNKYDDLFVHYYGGYEGAERVRGIIAPDYFVPKQSDFKIALYEVRYPERFANLHHGQILGSLTGSGIDRDHFGDIITDGKRWQFFVFDDISKYIEQQVDKIGSFKVHLIKKDFQNDLLMPIDESDDETINVQSLRLDTIIAEAYDLSRTQTKSMVEHGKVQLNWVPNRNPSAFATIYDTISVHGYGRIRVNNIMGKSKNNKYIIFVNVIKK